MYERMDYSVFRTVAAYYKGGVQPSEDAFGRPPTSNVAKSDNVSAIDMRKPCLRDKERKNFRTNGREIIVQPEDCFS